MACSMEEKYSSYAVEVQTPILRTIGAEVAEVLEKFLVLTSSQLEINSFIRVSPILACSLLTQYCESTCTDKLNLFDEFCTGDRLSLDVYQDNDDDEYIPMRINSMMRSRMDGLHLNCVGIIVNATEYSGVVIRSAELVNDIICQMNSIYVPDDCTLNAGVIVAFEATTLSFGVSDNYNFKGTSARVYPSAVKDAGFPIYGDVKGRIMQNDVGNSVHFRVTDNGNAPANIFPADRILPIYEGCYYGVGIPLKHLIGQYVSCVVCPQRPHMGENSPFEVIFVGKPNGIFALPENELPSSSNDDAINAGEGKKGHHFVECNMNYNNEMIASFRNAFLFVMDHTRPQQFQKMLEKFPRFARIMAMEIGLDAGQDSEDQVEAEAEADTEMEMEMETKEN